MSESTPRSAETAPAAAAKATPKAAKAPTPGRNRQLAIGALALIGLFTLAKGPIGTGLDSIEDAYRPQVHMVTVHPATPGDAK